MLQNYSKYFWLVVAMIGVAGVSEVRSQTRPVTSAVPFLLITPDARAAGMGDVGVATSPDVNATFWNPAKLVFAEKKIGAALSYTPWFRSLGVNDMWLGYLTGYYQLNRNQAFGLGLQYSNLGDISFTDPDGLPVRDFKPRELGFAPSFAQKFSKNFSGSVTVRLIYSNLSGNVDIAGSSGAQGRAGVTVGGDIALYYNKDLNLGGKDFNWAWGVNLSNVGPKISYSTRNEREFIATNLKFGSALTYNIDPYNKLTLAADINKLMVPTQKNPNSRPDDPLISGIFGSVADAPGGFSEELKEYIWSVGAEYWYNDMFALRAGYFNESREKGYRQYFTAGVGVRYTALGLDFAYLAPRQGRQSPLAETLRFTLHFNIGETDKEEETK